MSVEPVPAADYADLERYVGLLWQPGDVRELRSLNHGRVASGYFDDPARLVQAAAAWDGRANLYLTANPVLPALLARAENRIETPAQSTTADPDIVERRWLPIDIDPLRPSGVSATDAESAAALDVTRRVVAYLAGQGWPEPVVAMSGNGYWLFYPTRLPNDAASLALVTGVLRHLAERFDNDQVVIDKSSSNASRIVALVGTRKLKGDATADRPHRRSSLVYVPEQFAIVSAEQLAELVPETGSQPATASDTSTAHGWVRELLDGAGIAYREQPPDAAGIIWYGLKTCPYHEDGVPWQCGVGEAPDGPGTGKCFHNRGAGKGWHEFKTDLGLDRQISIVAPPQTKPVEPAVAPLGIDAVDLLALKLPPLRMIVPELLPEGTTILAAPPKVGKSCLVYQIVTEVAIGGAPLGRRVSPGSCLYLALEDGRRRGQDRLTAALGGRTLPRGRLEIRWGAKRIGEGLEKEILDWLDEHQDAAVVAIDTLQRVRPRTNGRRNAYEVDVDDLGRVQTLFRDRQVALLIVHHAHKATGDDFLASVSGTYGITGSADTTIVIRRTRLEAFGTIVTTGRDIAEAEISVRFDGMLWHEAPGVLAAASFERAELYDAIKHHGPIFPAGLAKMLHKERTNVQHMVDGLVSGGAVARMRNGYEAVPQRQMLYISPLTPITLESEQSEQGYEGAKNDYPASAWDTGDDVA